MSTPLKRCVDIIHPWVEEQKVENRGERVKTDDIVAVNAADFMRLVSVGIAASKLVQDPESLSLEAIVMDVYLVLAVMALNAEDPE